MDCRQVRELADSFLSEQLLVETNHEVLRHLETCAACRAELSARGAIRDRLRSAFAASSELAPRPEFASELASRLRPSSSVVSRRSLLRSWWTAAAGVVLAVGGGVAIRQMRSRSSLAALAVTAAGDHQNCAITFNLSERPIPLDDAGRRFGMPFARLASFDIRSSMPDVQSLDSHSCIYEGHRFAHFVVRYRGAVTSLLVADGAAAASPQIERDDRPVVASFGAGEYAAFVVADLPGADVLAFAQAIEGPLNEHLSA